MFYFSLSFGITIVNEESFKKSLDSDCDLDSYRLFIAFDVRFQKNRQDGATSENCLIYFLFKPVLCSSYSAKRVYL